MRAKACHLDDPADRSLIDQLSGKHCRFHMEPFAVIHHVLLSGFCCLLSRLFQLFQCGKRRFICKIVLLVVHHPQAQFTALGGYGGTGHKLNVRIIQNFFLGGSDLDLRKGVLELINFSGSGSYTHFSVAPASIKPLHMP